mgnify:CR=1 FL=1
MKQLLVKISTLTLAFLVLFSTLSFTVEKHYCGDFLVDVSFAGKAEGCGMKMDSKIISIKKNCCKDEIHQIEGQDELQQASDVKFNIKNQQFLIAFTVSYEDLFIKKESKKTFQKYFIPPDIILDYQVLHQTFLI